MMALGCESLFFLARCWYDRYCHLFEWVDPQGSDLAIMVKHPQSTLFVCQVGQTNQSEKFSKNQMLVEVVVGPFQFHDYYY